LDQGHQFGKQRLGLSEWVLDIRQKQKTLFRNIKGNGGRFIGKYDKLGKYYYSYNKVFVNLAHPTPIIHKHFLFTQTEILILFLNNSCKFIINLVDILLALSNLE
jgi:hypothetical protein